MWKELSLFVILSALLASAVQPPTPIFLRDASEEAKQEFYRIITTEGSTKEQKQQLVDALIARQPSNVQDAYRTFRAEMAERQAQNGETVSSKLDSLSAQAKQAIQQMNAIEHDSTLSTQTVFSSLPQSVQQELRALNKESGTRPLVTGKRQTLLHQ